MLFNGEWLPTAKKERNTAVVVKTTLGWKGVIPVPISPIHTEKSHEVFPVLTKMNVVSSSNSLPLPSKAIRTTM
jgi:hypothetical protein